MAKLEHPEIIRRDVKEWNQWRKDNPNVIPSLREVDLCRADLRRADLRAANLSGADLRRAKLSEADLRRADLRRADLRRADLRRADLRRADLREANLREANLSEANLSGADLGGADLNWADLSGVYLREANLSGANLSGAYLRGAYLGGANLRGANLSVADLSNADLSKADLNNADLRVANLSVADLRGANLSVAILGATIFGSNDLSSVKGLDNVEHQWPSTIGIDTIYSSGGRIPDVFLRGCGVDENFIRFIPSLLGAVEPFQLYSCFISYSTKDEEFANRLHSRLRDAKARVWFAPEDIKGGEKIYEQIERAIQLHDRLLLVLSENSLRSNWVESEIRKAIETEKRENRRKLFPIRITDYETLKMWRCFDADSGRDLAVEVREYFIPNFSNWKNQDSFEAAFDKLLRDLRAGEESPESKM
jgi:uncharacterized protein YjbI with pentapeptide repeats